MNNFNDTQERKYLRAKRRIDKLRGFYGHLAAYLIVNICLTIVKVSRNLNNGESFDQAFFEFSTFALWIFWGLGLLVHGFATFGIEHILGKDWEEDHIKEYMQEEEDNFNY